MTGLLQNLLEEAYISKSRFSGKPGASAPFCSGVTVTQCPDTPGCIRHFYYFGGHAAEIPSEYSDLIVVRGYKYKHNPDTVRSFLGWLETSFKFSVISIMNQTETR